MSDQLHNLITHFIPFFKLAYCDFFSALNVEELNFPKFLLKHGSAPKHVHS